MIGSGQDLKVRRLLSVLRLATLVELFNFLVYLT